MKNITWYGQGSLRFVTDGKTVYIDPLWIVEDMHDADVILITHSHFDHLSEEDISKVINDNTIIAAPQNCVEQLKAAFSNEILAVNPGEKHIVNGIHIQAVWAYNIVKTQCHPKENNWLGYIVTTQYGKYYYTGDTEKIPEMNKLDVDVIFLPLGQTYTMDSVQQAADVAKVTNAKIVIPVHFGSYEGKASDVHMLKMLLDSDDIEVVELPRTK
jgi:L-ascorbate metabolism protein UlaG (beta-lactamase superfamily)